MVGGKELRRRLYEEIDIFGSSLTGICRDMDLDFESEPSVCLPR